MKTLKTRKSIKYMLYFFLQHVFIGNLAYINYYNCMYTVKMVSKIINHLQKAERR
jgi:hypothetical protein